MAGSSGLESSDMNDGDILANTTQVPCKNGHQFKYVLPDGHPITSECISAEKKREALHIWVDAVKSAAVARAKAEREELAAKIRRQKADANLANEAQAAAAMGLIVPSGTVPAAPIPRTAPYGVAAVSGAAAGPNDPVAMAKSELVSAMMEVQQLQPKLAAAQQRVTQWKAVLQALQGVELPQESAVIDSNTQLRELLEQK